MVILLALYSIIILPGVRESEEMKQMFLTAYDKAEETSFFNNLKIALKTKNFRVSLAGYTITLTATTLFGGSTIYMFRYVYGLDYALTAIPALIGVIASLCMIPFWSNFARKHGFKKTYATAYIIHGFLFLPFLFTFDLITHTIVYVLYSMVYIGEVTMLMPVASDTYDEVSSNVGRRVDASLVGIRTFFFRVALLVQAIVFTAVFVATGFNAAAETQSPTAQFGIRINAALIPAIIMITMGFIFKKYYTLEGAEKEALVRKLKDLGIYR
jgi:GPH family glycoside/pentoside/hexuronide:cation symporter